jgi:hypothetical protein
VLEVDGPVAELVHPLDHYPFSKGIAHWVAKHNVYSTMEAELIVRGQGLHEPSVRAALGDEDFHTRRRHQKALFYRMPGRPLIKWCYMMFVRGAVLDGAAGVAYATLQSIYEYHDCAEDEGAAARRRVSAAAFRAVPMVNRGCKGQYGDSGFARMTAFKADFSMV